MREVFGYDTRMLSKDEIDSQYVRDADSCGAMHEAEGIGIHPLKLAFAYLRQLRELGVKVHPSSPVLGVKTIKGVHHLRTPNGTVRALWVLPPAATPATACTRAWTQRSCRSCPTHW